MGCGGFCGKYNDGICMGACSMDEVGREAYAKIQEEKLAKKAERQNLAAQGVVLKPINPGAYAMFDEPTLKAKVVTPSERISPLTSEDTRSFLRMKL